MRIDWNFPDGMDEMLKLIAEKEGAVGEALKESIRQGQQELFEDYQAGLQPHKDTGDALDSLDAKPVEIDGNTISGDVGSFMDKNDAGYFHAKYQEYGAFVRDGGTTSNAYGGFRRATGRVTFVADPWKRPADDMMKKRFPAIVRAIMKRRLAK